MGRLSFAPSTGSNLKLLLNVNMIGPHRLQKVLVVGMGLGQRGRVSRKQRPQERKVEEEVIYSDPGFV
jgi:hypothetical protein